jgi:hypothetical protein
MAAVAKVLFQVTLVFFSFESSLSPCLMLSDGTNERFGIFASSKI